MNPDPPADDSDLPEYIRVAWSKYEWMLRKMIIRLEERVSELERKINEEK